MKLVLADPDRLVAAWSIAAQAAAARSPENVRKRQIDGVLFDRGIFARMQAATAAAKSREFRDRIGEAREAREAARNEADVARLCEAILISMGVDMTALQVRLRRRTTKEMRSAGAPRQAAGIAMRITPTLEAARAAVAAVDGQPSDGLPGISITGAADASGVDEHSGHGDVSI